MDHRVTTRSSKVRQTKLATSHLQTQQFSPNKIVASASILRQTLHLSQLARSTLQTLPSPQILIPTPPKQTAP